MNKTALDLWVGLFVALGIIAVAFLSLRVGTIDTSGSRASYELKAKFDNIGGLKPRAPIKSAGVVVGRVTDIHFDPQDYVAVVSMAVDGRYQFPRDTFATINTAGLLGEQYIGLEVGGDPDMFKAGDTIKKTQSAVVLEKLISQFMFSKASESTEKK